jgi:outer membrane protein TolC
MKRILIILLFLPFLSFSQEISLDTCISAAEKNWPAFKKQLSLENQRELIDKTLNKNYLPKLNFSGQATYQSEVVSLASDNPMLSNMFPELPLDNYTVEANINQTIWDGGIVKSQKGIQNAANNIDVQQLNVETYGLNGKINQLYINYIFLIQNEEILNLSKNELVENIDALQSAVDNGMMLNSEIDNVKAEELKLQKELLNVTSSKEQILSSLNIITGLNLDKSYDFTQPKIVAKTNPIRPEINLLNAQIEYTQSNIASYKTNRMPKLMAFGKVGYGRPGFDMFNVDMHSYYLVGAKFSWDVWDWNMLSNQKQQIKIKQTIIEDNKEVLSKQINMEQIQYQQDIAKHTKQIEFDVEIEKLKENVYQSSKSQFNNGTITSTEFLKLFNELKRAKLATKLDELQLLKAKLNYEYSLGIEQIIK